MWMLESDYDCFVAKKTDYLGQFVRLHVLVCCAARPW